MGLQFKNFQTLDEALKTNSTNTYPYVIVVGDPTSASSSAEICKCNTKSLVRWKAITNNFSCRNSMTCRIIGLYNRL